MVKLNFQKDWFFLERALDISKNILNHSKQVMGHIIIFKQKPRLTEQCNATKVIDTDFPIKFYNVCRLFMYGWDNLNVINAINIVPYYQLLEV